MTINIAIPHIPVQIDGRDSRNQPRQWYADRLFCEEDASLVRKMSDVIRLTRIATPGHDCHWQVEVCLAEAKRRGNPALSDEALRRASSGWGVV